MADTPVGCEHARQFGTVASWATPFLLEHVALDDPGRDVQVAGDVDVEGDVDRDVRGLAPIRLHDQGDVDVRVWLAVPSGREPIRRTSSRFWPSAARTRETYSATADCTWGDASLSKEATLVDLSSGDLPMTQRPIHRVRGLPPHGPSRRTSRRVSS